MTIVELVLLLGVAGGAGLGGALLLRALLRFVGRGREAATVPVSSPNDPR